MLEAAPTGPIAGPDGPFVSSPATAQAAVQLAAQNGDQGKVKIVTFDLSSLVAKYIKDGTILGAVWQEPYLQGYLPVIDASLQVKYSMHPIGNIAVGPIAVTKANYAQFATAFASGLE